MSFTRKSIADHLDSYDDEIATLQEGKRETLADYRQQLADAGMSKGGIKAEIEALKVAMRRRRAIAKKGEEVVEEADVLADEIFAEITSRAPRATRVREDIEEFDADTGEVIEDQPETATESQAKASEDNGRISANEGAPMTGEVSRQRQRRRDSGERPAPNSADNGCPEGQAMTSLEPHEMDRHAVTAGETATNPPSTGVIPSAGCTAPSESAADEISESVQTSSPEPIKAGEGVPPLSPAILSDEEVVPAFMKDKPGCLKLRDGHCKISFATEALCSECAHKQARAEA